ncbi:hypothetical protein PSTG_17033 [Puccinia striiformis f. sp. tritici PST-78]|uniref:Retrotransposon gag domain-containing protein n=2 Tax=Puccinia striiformis f. sp. tritici TaxID=168172 RepID=A0A0L0US08_9BASI|nr:hypothetical protein PSTG_17033 [Puccinia striiformis f. sp. tritici PST-78]
MSTRRSASTNRSPLVDDPEAIIRKANTAKRLAAKEKAARSQLVVPSVIPLDTTPEESSLTRTEVPTPNLESNSTRPENSTFKPLPLPTTLIPTLPSSEIDDTLFVDPASIPLPDDGHPLNLPPAVDPTSIPLPVDNLPSPFLRPHEMQNSKMPAPPGTGTVNDPPKDLLNEQPTGENTPTGPIVGQSTRELLRALLTCQQASVNQAIAHQANWEDRMAKSEAASAARIARLEEVFIGVAVKSEDNSGSPRPASNQVDHWRFKASEGPAYDGPYQEIEPFVVWMNAIELFFTSKDISSDRDRIIIAGERIKETNLMGFYKMSASKLLLGTWEEFKASMFTYTIPSRWRTTLQRQIRFIKIGSNKTFTQYTLRARTLQQLLNFDQLTISDHELAVGMTFGLGEDLENRINEHKILEADPFDFNVFVRRVGDCVRTMTKKHPTRTTNATTYSTQASSPTNYLSNNEYIWRIHAYLDSVGLCHFCKKHCGNISGGRPGPLNRERVPIPASFKAPPKPANYIAPQAWKGSANRPPAPSAGRATSRPAGVAAVTDDDSGDWDDTIDATDPEAGNLDYLAAISVLSIVDEELATTKTDEATVASYTGIDPATVAALWDIPEDDSDEEDFTLEDAYEAVSIQVHRLKVSLGSLVLLVTNNPPP